MAALPYLIAYVVPLTAALGLSLGGPWAFATLIFVFVLTPGLDAVLGLDTRNVEDEAAQLANPWFDRVLLAWIPLQLGVMAWTVWAVAVEGRAPLDAVGLVLSAGVVGAAGLNVAHELMHRKDRTHRGLAELLCASVTYTHFCVEHVHGHHKNVATPQDPASARRGETVYGFLPRSILGGIRSAWRIEAKRARARGEAGTLRDRRLRYGLGLAALYGVTAALAGPTGALALFGMGAVAVGHLEVINYVEHYGLQRAALGEGRYERVGPDHSWNSAHRLTGLYLFGLPRHADHHYLASRPYPILRHHPDSPQLPAGYATMLLLAMVPPAWFAVMEPRLDALQGRPTGEAAAEERAAA